MAIMFILDTQTRYKKLLNLHEIYHIHFNFNNTEIDYLHSTNIVLYFFLLGVLSAYQATYISYGYPYICTHHPLLTGSHTGCNIWERNFAKMVNIVMVNLMLIGLGLVYMVSNCDVASVGLIKTFFFFFETTN